MVKLTNWRPHDNLLPWAMAKTVNLYEAKTHLSRLVDRAAEGEEIIIAKGGAPKARLVPLRARKAPRRPGGGKGKVWMAENFDAPLPPEILEAFGEKRR